MEDNNTNTIQDTQIPSDEVRNRRAAMVSLIYLLLMLALFLWLLFDTWIEQNALANLLGYGDAPLLETSIYKLLTYAFLGGGLGGTLNGIRSVIKWHSDRNQFDRRYIWKYIAIPWQGASLALVAFSLIGSGMALLGGEINLEDASIRQALSVFAIGVLAGYGSRDVSIWLDAQVTRIFSVKEGDEEDIQVPNLIGMTIEEAEQALKELNLQVGEIRNQPVMDENRVGRVIDQDPTSDTSLVPDAEVNLIVGVAGAG